MKRDFSCFSSLICYNGFADTHAQLDRSSFFEDRVLKRCVNALGSLDDLSPPKVIGAFFFSAFRWH